MREGNPGGLLCHVAHSLGFHGDGISFWVLCLGNRSNSGSFLVVYALLIQGGRQQERSEGGAGGLTFGVSF